MRRCWRYGVAVYVGLLVAGVMGGGSVPQPRRVTAEPPGAAGAMDVPLRAPLVGDADAPDRGYRLGSPPVHPIPRSPCTRT